MSRRPSWRTRDDIKVTNKDESVHWEQGKSYRIRMSVGDWRLYQGAGLLSILVLIAIAAALVGLVVGS